MVRQRSTRRVASGVSECEQRDGSSRRKGRAIGTTMPRSYAQWGEGEGSVRESVCEKRQQEAVGLVLARVDGWGGCEIGSAEVSGGS